MVCLVLRWFELLGVGGFVSVFGGKLGFGSDRIG